MIPYDLALAIHERINNQVQYRSDVSKYATSDKWMDADNEGDCEDYALAKRSILRQHGYGDFCHIALCWTETNEYHAVLIVETDKGHYVLDNRHVFPKMKQDLGYRWDKWEKSGQWFALS